MPMYTYRCENCGVQFERRQKFSDDPLKRCPECSKIALRKVYLPVGIVFKGSGFLILAIIISLLLVSNSASIGQYS